VHRQRRWSAADFSRKVEIDGQVGQRRHDKVDRIADDHRAGWNADRRSATERERPIGLRRDGGFLSRSAMCAPPISIGAVPKLLLNTTRKRLPPIDVRTICLSV
jgi:hypothetical protein